MITQNLSAKRGDSWSGFMSQITMNGTPLNLSGSLIKMDLKKDSCDCSAVLALSSPDAGITILNPLSGIFQVDPRIIDILPRDYDYDIQITLSSLQVITPMGGIFTILSDVTR